MAQHTSVMLPEVLDLFRPKPGGMYLDATFGGGGHTRAILEAEREVTVVAIDQDPEAIARAESLKNTFKDHFIYYDLNFGDLDQVRESDFDGILFDLGVSSFQLDQAERGFSFRYEGPTDMRLDPRKGISAAEFLETANQGALIEAIRDFGEEARWRRVVEAIQRARGTGILSSTHTLADLIEKTIGRRPGARIHPATKTFQGIRMAVNRELFVIEQALPIAFDKLAIGGVLAVISFHSLEDRIIKRFFRKMAGKPLHGKDATPQDMRVSYAELLSNKPITPSAEEVQHNARSRSAKLRVLKKTNHRPQ